MATDYRRMQQLRGEAADWALNDIILLKGEIGFLEQGGAWRFKVGDGVGAWSTLPWIGETDATARADIVTLQADIVAHDTRLDALETDIAAIATIEADIVALTSSVSGKQDILPGGTDPGDFLFWNGVSLESTAAAPTAYAMFYWDAVAETYVALPTPAAGASLRANDSGVPYWTSATPLQPGEESLPGASFSGDADTGLWRPGPDVIAFSTNAVERARINNSGLDVSGSCTIDGSLIVGEIPITGMVEEITTGVADVVFDIPLTWTAFEVRVIGPKAATTAGDLAMQWRRDGQVVYDTANYVRTFDGRSEAGAIGGHSTTQGHVTLALGPDALADRHGYATCDVFTGIGTVKPSCKGEGHSIDETPDFATIASFAHTGPTAGQIDRIRVFHTAGNLTAGTIVITRKA